MDVFVHESIVSKFSPEKRQNNSMNRIDRVASLPPAPTTPKLTTASDGRDDGDSSNSYEYPHCIPFQYSETATLPCGSAATAAATHRSKSSTITTYAFGCAECSTFLSTQSSTSQSPSSCCFSSSAHRPTTSFAFNCSLYRCLNFLSNKFVIPSSVEIFFLSLISASPVSLSSVFLLFSNFNLFSGKIFQSKLFPAKERRTARFNARFSVCDSYSSSPLCTVLTIILVLQLIAFNIEQCPVHALFYQNYQAYNALVGSSVSLPCNITPPTSDDGVSLILWYRDDQSSPIYTVDARIVMNVAAGKHHLDTTALSNRASFNLTFPVSYLHFAKLIERDTAEYRCRVDFRRGRTINRVMQLNVIVPSKSVTIRDSRGNFVNDIAGPFNEDSALNLTCDSDGGYPAASLRWFRGDVLLTNRSIMLNPDKRSVRSTVSFERLGRDNLMMPLTCESFNSNLTVPLSKTILVDLNLKPTQVQIIKPASPMRVGERVELICQSSGSRPPARIAWQKGAQSVGAHTESSSDDGTVTTNFLTFVPTMEDNGRILTCRATNPQFVDFYLEDKLHLDVHYPPILSLLLGASDQRGEILEGSNVYFDCDIQANPAVTKFEWTFNGQAIQDNSEMSNIEVRNNSIVINNVSRYHIGAYRCSADNPLGATVSDIVNLAVKYTPYCSTNQKIDFELPIYGQADIECRVESDPAEVTFYWEFNSTQSQDMIIDPESDEQNILEQEQYNQQLRQQQRHQPLMSIHNSGRTSRLRFTPTTESDFGTLFCYATNRLGRQKEPCIYHIRRSKTPHPPRNCTVIEALKANTTSLKTSSLSSSSLSPSFTSSSSSPSSSVSSSSSKSSSDTVTIQCEINPDDDAIFNLEVLTESGGLLANISSRNAHFEINHEQLRLARELLVLARNINGASVRVDITANITVAGEPRKLEHIETKMNGRPTLVLGIALSVALLLFVLVVLILLFHKRRSSRISKTPASNNTKSKNACSDEQAQHNNQTELNRRLGPGMYHGAPTMLNSSNVNNIEPNTDFVGDILTPDLLEEKTDFESKFPLAAYSLTGLDGGVVGTHPLLNPYSACNGFDSSLIGNSPGSIAASTMNLSGSGASYLELTNLDSIPDALSHTICNSGPTLNNDHLTEPILFLQTDCGSSGQVYSDCLGMSSDDSGTHTATISTIPCILVAQSHATPSVCIITTPTKSSQLSSTTNTATTTDEADSSSSINSSTLTRSAPKVRFID